MSKGTHDYTPDQRNASIKISLNGELVAREDAKVSVFDAGYVLGDGVWEGLRLHDGGLPFLDTHLDHLYEGAKAIDLDIGLTREQLTERILETVRANGMRDHVHIRLMVTRGLMATPHPDPRFVIGPPTIVIVPEYKEPLPETAEHGIRLFTVHVRRGAPDVQDPKLNSHSKLNCILACIQAQKAGCDEALMLDPHGFVATCSSSHFFIVRKGEVWTSTGKYCLGGIARANVVRVCHNHKIPIHEKDFSLTDVYGADEAFVTDMFAGLTPVHEIDGRTLGERGPMCTRLQALYQQLVEREGRAGVRV
ncbi:MAG: aminotransferase class IV [Rhodanobacteraceae bacterium]